MASVATARRRREFGVALFVMLLGAAAELMTIGAVLPFLAIIADPTIAQRNHTLSGLLRFLGPWAQVHYILVLALILSAAAAVAAGIRLLLTWVSLDFVLKFGHDIGTAIYGRMVRQPYQYYVTRNTSDFLAGFEKLHAVIYALLLPVMQGVTSGIIALLIILLLFTIDPLAATVSAITMLATYGLVSVATRARLHRNSEIWSETADGRVRIIQEGLGGLRDILLDRSQSVFERVFQDYDLRYRKAQSASNFIAQAPRYVVEAAGIVIIAMLAAYMSTRPGGLVGAISILGALAIGAQRLLPLLQLAYNGWSSFASNQTMLIDVAALLRTPVIAAASEAASGPPFARDITFEKVSFAYLDRSRALADIDLTIRKGERLGIVGKTGSGKSSLMDLLLGLLQPSAGRILIDGVPLDQTTLSAWQAQIAHVPQMIYLSDSSVAANIAFGEADDKIDLQRVRHAARQAEVDQFIESMPEGYATSIGERGIRLSGGQRQRLGIARALYKGATMLVFDEATSALDGDTEASIMRSIAQLPGDITLVLIAHRTSTLSGCDRIIRLDHGKLVETGSYASLLGRSDAAAEGDG